MAQKTLSDSFDTSSPSMPEIKSESVPAFIKRLRKNLRFTEHDTLINSKNQKFVTASMNEQPNRKSMELQKNNLCRNSFLDFIKVKREVLLAKLRINSKKQTIKEIREQMAYKENLLAVQANDLQQTTALVRNNLESLKLEIEIRNEEVNKLTEVKLDTIRRLEELRNLVAIKKGENQVLEDRAQDHMDCRDFVYNVFEFYRQPFDEEKFLSYFAKLSKDLERIFNARNNWSKAKKKLLQKKTAQFTDFFLTATSIVKHRSIPVTMCEKEELPTEFQKMLDLIEKEQFEMIEEMNSGEMNLIDTNERLDK